MDIEKVAFSIFLSKLESPELIEKFSERKNGLGETKLETIVHLSYKDLKETVPELFKENKYEEAMLLILKSVNKKVNFATVRASSNYDKLKFLFWIQDQYKQINLIEQQYLTLTPDSEMTAAGVNELDELGDTNLIDALAKGDILKWRAIKELPYEMIFDKQRKSTIESKIERKMRQNQKIKR